MEGETGVGIMLGRDGLADDVEGVGPAMDECYHVSWVGAECGVDGVADHIGCDLSADTGAAAVLVVVLRPDSSLTCATAAKRSLASQVAMGQITNPLDLLKATPKRLKRAL
jgi:hypothetical protein